LNYHKRISQKKMRRRIQAHSSSAVNLVGSSIIIATWINSIMFI
jgi:hypothetical protein